jgi:hypothetical protein
MGSSTFPDFFAYYKILTIDSQQLLVFFLTVIIEGKAPTI